MKINRKLGKSGHIALAISGVLAVALIYGNLVSSLVSADGLSKVRQAVTSLSAFTITKTTNNQCGSITIGKGATNASHLQLIISRGNQEIDRRLATLDSLSAKINAATHLTASDKVILSNEVSTTISGLTTLKAQLDSATTVCAAIADAQSIYTEYRVYALTAPKIELIKVADDQLTVQADLNTLSVKLQARITTDQNDGKNVTALQNDLNSMNGLITSAGSISSNVESGVINLLPSDYNSNHSVLVGDSAQLRIAHNDDQTAYQDAKTIVAGLKSLG